MSNAAKNEVLSSFRETINNSLAEMDHRKLKHLFTSLPEHIRDIGAQYSACLQIHIPELYENDFKKNC